MAIKEAEWGSPVCFAAQLEKRVLLKLSSLNPNKAPGPDGVHSQLLKNCASNLMHPLFLLYTQSLNSGIIPEE